MENNKIFACFLIVLIVSAIVNARPQDIDLVERDANGEQPNPGWVRRQLMRLGDAASRVGSGMGGYAVRLTNAVDRVCKVIKKIIPIVGAVCTVGQFKFCALDNTTGENGDSMDGGYNIAVSGVGQQTNLEALDK